MKKFFGLFILVLLLSGWKKNPELEMKWKFSVLIGSIYNWSIVNEGKIYFGGWPHIYCVDAETGEKIWKYPVYERASICIEQEYLYASTEKGKFYKINKNTGVLVKEQRINTDWLSESVFYKNDVIIKSGDNFLYFLDRKTLKIKNKIELGNTMYSIKPVIKDNILITGNEDGKLFAFDLQNYKKMWTFEVENKKKDVFFSIPVFVDEKVYFGCYNYIYCIDLKTGKELWKSSKQEKGICWIKLSNNKIYILTYAGTFYIYNQEKDQREEPVLGKCYGLPCEYNNYIYYGTVNTENKSCFKRIDLASGNCEVLNNTEKNLPFGPPVIDNGYIFFNNISGDENLYCLKIID